MPKKTPDAQHHVLVNELQGHLFPLLSFLKFCLDFETTEQDRAKLFQILRRFNLLNISEITVAMEKLSETQRHEQGQQIQAQPWRPQPSAEQLSVVAAQNKKKRKAPELSNLLVEDPLPRPESPQSTGVHNQLSLKQGQAINLAPNYHKHNPDILMSEVSPDQANTELRQQLRKEIRKKMETEWESKLAEKPLDVENLWRNKLRKKAKEVELETEYLCGKKRKQKIEEVVTHYKKKLEEAESHRNNDDMRALREEIDKLKKRLEKGPSLIKAAEERGRREGELEGYNKISLNPDLKPSQDRQNFDYLMKEKHKELADVKAARDSLFNDARKFGEETNAKIRARDQEIQRLQAELQAQPTQQPRAPDNTNALIAEGRALQVRFDSQMQELHSLRENYDQQATNMIKLLDLFQKKSEESSNHERQSDIKSKELSLQSEELRRSTEEVSSLRRENNQKCVQLKEISEQLAKTWGQLKQQRGEHYKNWLELGVYERQIKAQSNEIASLRARHQRVEVQSEETASLRSRHGDSKFSKQGEEKDRIIASLRELLHKSNPHQSTIYSQEEAKLLRRRLAKGDSKLVESESRLNAALIENASLRQNQDRIKKAMKVARDKGRMARTQASISWSHLEHAGRILSEQNAALAAVWLDKLARDNRVSELEAQLGWAVSTLEYNLTQLKDAEGKAAELITANGRVAELEAEKEEMKSQDRRRTKSGPEATPPEFFSDAETVPIKRFGKYRDASHRGRTKPRDEYR